MTTKQAVLKEVLVQLKREWETLTRAAAEARGEATHAETKSESKYDTRGLEASYLAGGQARRAAEVQQAIDALRLYQPPVFKEGEAIRVGALVIVERQGEVQRYFLLPYVGGVQVTVNGERWQAVSIQAPLGQELLGKLCGDEFVFQHKNYVVLEVE